MNQSDNNILFIGSPGDLHNIKWISFFSKSGGNAYLICESSDLNQLTDKTKKLLIDNNIIFLGSIPSFSISNPISLLICFFKLRGIIKKYKIGIFHMLFGTYAPYGLLVKIPVIITTRGSDILLFIPQFIKKKFTGPIWEYIYRNSFRKAIYITCTSYKQRQKIRNQFYTPYEKLRVIRTGVEVKTINESSSDYLPEGLSGKKFILMPRYLKPVYNNELIIEALIKLKHKYSEAFDLVFIKNITPDEKYVQKVLEPLKTANYKIHVFQEIAQKEIWACFKNASLSIMTPLSDGTPNTALEAMAAKCPLILGEYDYDPDLFDGVCLRLDKNTPDILANAIDEALQNYPQNLIDAAYQRVDKLGNRRIEMQKLNQIYLKTIYKERKEFISPIIINRPYCQCAKCILDTTDDPDIFFSEQGICNHCLKYEEDYIKYVKSGEKGRTEFLKMLEEIKKDGSGKKYDCIIGVSGGVDSSYVSVIAKRMGLRALCVHLDNGWNSELATINIENLVKKLNFDLHTYVIDWEEFRDLQLSYLKASVIDIEVLTDHAMLACLHKSARHYNIKYILSGHNVVTEAVIPPNFNYDKTDSVNIKHIHNQFGKIHLKTYPFYSALDKLLNKYIYKVTFVRLLNYLDYNKKDAMEILKKELGWREYGVKHGESTFTKFYQLYILPNKFHIDKRKAHLSNLICSGQITKEQALEEMKKPLYEMEELKNDLIYVCKKLNISENEFENYISQKPIAHEFYGVEKPVSDRLWLLRFIKTIIRSFN